MANNSAATTLPYLASPGSIKNALDKIKVAATPDRVTRDFISTKLQIKGGTGSALIPYLKKIGFVGADGSPTDIYKRFRNHTTEGRAAADAIRFGYKALSQANEYFYDLNEKDLLALIVQVTGSEQGDQVSKLTFSTLKILKSFAKFEPDASADKSDEESVDAGAEAVDTVQQSPSGVGRVGIGLSYTINLNLPATSDQAVFNAIFRSLKEHLLTSDE
jgi:hypothetical protein